MAVKKSYIISLALSLALCAPVVNSADNNSLVQLDLKRASDNSVDITLVTTENYGENVLVRKKSDSKYVILIPKVKSTGYRASNLAGVNDLVQSVDVKTVDDTSGGYTKVTLITTKPLDIKTRTTKSAPITSEQNEYNNLIAKANTVRNSVSTAVSMTELPVIREQKTEVTVNKAPQVTKQEIKEPQKPIAEKVNKPDIKLNEVSREDLERYTRKAHLAELKNEIRMESMEEIPDTVPENPAPVVNEEVQEITEMPAAPKVTLMSKIKGKVKKAVNKIPSKLPKTAGAVLLAIIAVTMISKLGKKTENAAISSTDDIPQPDLNVSENYDNMLNNSELSWKEKYKLYLDKSATPVARANKKGHYTFIKKPSVSAIDKKRAELEKMLKETEKVNDFNEFEELNIEPEIVESEDNVINQTIKLKAFDNTANSLKMTSRNRRSRFKRYENEIPLHEQKTIELDESPLFANKRNLKGANLKVSDVDRRRITYEPSDYIMSSVDEFFSIKDNEEKQEIKTTPKIPVVRENDEVPQNTVSNPIEKSKNSTYFKGTIVKSSFKIGQDKGIYLVNKNGKNSLVGKVKDKVFVLKKFDGNITNPIQVRHDNANVYMVKAGGFKSLVEVNDDKMGVLIEL
ncbi:hypothetical protein J6P92_00430 [bacterium]|nr:hypothetical protein [bacterium]